MVRDVGMDRRLLVLGLSHRTAPVAQREKARLADLAARSLLGALLGHPAVVECAVLSTCNRTELLAVVADPAWGEAVLSQALVDHSRIARHELAEARYVHDDEVAARHLFRVAAGLDSMVLGESEVQGQVRAARELARAAGTLGPLLDRTFANALRRAGACARRREWPPAPCPCRPSPSTSRAWRSATSATGGRCWSARAGPPRRRRGRCWARASPRSSSPTAPRPRRSHSPLASAAARPASTRWPTTWPPSTSSSRRPTPRRRSSTRTASRARSSAGAGGRSWSSTSPSRATSIRASATLPGVCLYDIDDLRRVADANLDGRRREAVRAEAIVAAEVRRFAAGRSLVRAAA